MPKLRNVLEYDELSKLSYELLKSFLPECTEYNAPTHEIVGMFIDKIGEFEFEGFEGRREAAIAAELATRRKVKKEQPPSIDDDDEEEF